MSTSPIVGQENDLDIRVLYDCAKWSTTARLPLKYVRSYFESRTPAEMLLASLQPQREQQAHAARWLYWQRCLKEAHACGYHPILETVYNRPLAYLATVRGAKLAQQLAQEAAFGVLPPIEELARLKGWRVLAHGPDRSQDALLALCVQAVPGLTPHIWTYLLVVAFAPPDLRERYGLPSALIASQCEM